MATVTQILLEYRGPDDYDLVFDDTMFDAMEAAKLMELTGIDMQAHLRKRGYIDTSQETLQ